MTEAEIEKEIQEKGLTKPRLTPSDIDAQIAKKQFHRFEGTTVTVCCLTLQNDFNCVGKSACASPENYDKELGERIAFEKAREQIWELEGYLLKSELAAVDL